MVLGRLGAYQQRLYSELRQLAAWPRSAARTLDDVLAEALGYAARLLNGPTVMLIWEDSAEEQTQVAVFRDGRIARESPSATVAGPRPGSGRRPQLPFGARFVGSENDRLQRSRARIVRTGAPGRPRGTIRGRDDHRSGLAAAIAPGMAAAGQPDTADTQRPTMSCSPGSSRPMSVRRWSIGICRSARGMRPSPRSGSGSAGIFTMGSCSR